MRSSTGSIPACAGEPFFVSDSLDIFWVYPRVCGGTTIGPAIVLSHRGLSPRVRGNQQVSRYVASLIGSIPACAGEPLSSVVRTWSYRVYPRVCGGTFWVIRLPAAPRGLSPRVRGNLFKLTQQGICKGSIPACAGEPSIPSRALA